jgi:CRISPR-associated protein Cmr4
VDAETIVLEDFALSVTENEGVGNLAEWLGKHAFPNGSETESSPYNFWADRLKTNLVVIDDNSFRDFVQFSTQVDTHIRIAETGTVEAGALWTEESLPPETLLYTLVLATNPRTNHDGITDATKVIESVADWIQAAPILQFGGNETTGQGIIKATFLDRQTPSVDNQGGSHATGTTS